MLSKKNKKNKTAKRVYNKKDYNSGDGMLTSVWGPSLWHYLHVISFNYPINPTLLQKKNINNLLQIFNIHYLVNIVE